MNDTPMRPEATAHAGLRVVGGGASAGGLKALEQLRLPQLLRLNGGD